MSYPKLVENLIENLSRLPGIGRRSAERIVYWFLKESSESAKDFAESIVRLKDGMQFCRNCNHLADHGLCSICTNPARDKSTICVVESPKDVIAIEKSGAYKGHYHVLLGAISPMEGRGPDDIKLGELIVRIRAQDVKEIVIATDPDTEGEMTALHVTKMLRPTGVRISRIGLGIPVGSSVEYVDISTLSMSLTSRREIPVEDTAE